MQISVNYKGTNLYFEEIPTPAQIQMAYERHHAGRRTTPSNGAGRSIPRAPRGLDTPLSFGQQRVWFLNLFEPGSPYYNVSLSVRVKGRLNAGVFQRTLDEIIGRHEVLRTTFPSNEGRPVQVIAPDALAELTLADFRHLPEAERERQAVRLATEKAREPFDLARGPLFRANLIRLETRVHLLTLTLHHIVSDGWSLEVLVREMALIYNAFSKGEPSPLKPLPIQYADYAVWQRQTLSGSVLEEHLSYWRQKLGGTLPVLQLPTDRARPAVQTFRGARQTFSLGRTLTERVKILNRKEGVTLYMTLLAAFGLLLHRHSGQEDILVGTPTANRGQVELEGLIGIFTNTLILRTDFSGDPTVRELLGRVRETALGAYAHQDVPFEKLVEVLRPERDLSRTPLFQVMLNLLNIQKGKQSPALEETDLVLETLEVETGTAQFDLNLSMNDGDEGLVGSLEYSTDLFDAATVRRMVRRFRALLECMVSDPGRRIGRVELLSDAERHQLLREWNDTAAPRRGPAVFESFERQAAAAPDSVAVVAAGRQLTYGELNARANQLARHLIGIGVGPESLVALAVERTPEMLVSLLGVLKAGAAYLPLDPEYPQARLRLMVDDAGAEVLLTQAHLLGRMGPGRARVVCLDSDWGVIGQQGRENLESEVAAEQLAYVIYTSGSTGGPKGVMVSHGALSNFLRSMRERPGLGGADVLLAVTTLSFDIAALELYLPLTVGARVELVGREEILDAAGLGRRLGRGVMMQATPSLWRALVEGGGWSAGGDCRVLCGGEALPRQLAEELAQRAGTVWNMYGPTETTIWSSVDEVSEGEAVTIGRPIANTQLYIVDELMRPAPVGVSGELLIGGDGVARGYLNRSSLTAERFVPDPFSCAAGARLYRTGDVARWLADGRVECLGRNDQQVKVRGHRIELGEIEAALETHAGVGRAVVSAREGSGGEKRLVAYVVAATGAVAPGASELREHLRGRLPEYMVPSVFVALEELPLTPNGKVDRKALPEPRREAGREAAGARTATEEVLAGVWGEALGVESVGIHDNFFELGGDSILAIQVIAKANRAGLHLTPKLLFQHQTIAELALTAGSLDGGADQAEQGRVTGQIPFTPWTHWFFDQRQPTVHHWNQAVITEVHRSLDARLLERVVRHLLDHHDALRMRFTETAEGWRQWNAVDESQPVFSHVDLSALADSQARAVSEVIEQAAEELQRSLNLTRGPIVRVALFDLGAVRPSRLLIVIHHLAVDGVSWRILIEDLQRGYEQLSRGERIDFGRKTTSYRQWAEKLVEYAQGREAREELAYWTAAVPASVEPLPADYPDGRNSEESRRAVWAGLGEEETRVLLQQLPEVYHTQINDLLLTALAEAFSRWTGGRNLLLDFEGHGREDVLEGLNVSRTVGRFVTFHPVYLNLPPPECGTGEKIKSVKEQLRRVRRNGINFGVLRYLSADPAVREQLGSLPHPRVSYNYLGQIDQSLAGPLQLAKPAEGVGHSVDGRIEHLHWLAVTARVEQKRLAVEWTYSENMYARSTVESLAGSFIEALRSIIEHCRLPEAGGYTPSDFPLARLSQTQLDRLCQAYPSITDVYTLSPTQLSLLFHYLYERNSGTYFLQLVWKLNERLDPQAFERAWQTVIDRHTALRAAFVWEGLEQPLQIISKANTFRINKEDWRASSGAEQQRRLDEFLKADRSRRADLTQAPLIRLSLLQTAEDSYFVVLSYSQLLTDGWGLMLALNDVFTSYRAICEGRAAQLEYRRPYREYIAWLTQQDQAGTEKFWREALGGFRAPTPLVVDHPPAQSTAPIVNREEEVRLPVATSAALKSLARQLQVTLNTALQGAWALLLGRYSGHDDVLFGAPVAARPATLPGSESMVGLFFNTLPVRVRLPSDESVATWLRGLQSQQGTARQFDYSSLSQVHGWSDVPRSLPLFESILVVENHVLHNAHERSGSVAIERIREVDQPHYPLSLFAVPEDELWLRFSYQEERFDPFAVRRMLGHFRQILESMVGDPGQEVGRVELLSDAERHQLLREWNDTTTAGRDATVFELFEERAAVAPDHVVLGVGERQLSYGELNARANQLARHLRGLGVGPESLVALAVERTPEMLVGLLGVLKAGAAYLPLDPEYPQARLRLMVDDAGAEVLLTQAHLLGRMGPGRARVVCLDRDWGVIGQQGRENLESEVAAEQLAYVIYTSGSTGGPKGVMVSHGALSNFLRSMRERPGLGSSDQLLAVTTLSFDIAALELYLPLTVGARMELVSRSTIFETEELRRRLEQSTMMQATPSLWRMLVESGGWEGGHCKLLAGGEGLPRQLARQLAERAPSVWNMYGPTETTIWSSVEQVSRSEEAREAYQSIGRPIDNTQFYILDGRLRPVPVGVGGELYIGGDGVARGYLRRPELTAARFIPDAWSGAAGARCYGTGDVARYLADGRVEYLGREDQQVKVRGHRIELGEIEGVLAEHPRVRAAVVVARADGGGQEQLAAYVVAEGEVGAGELRGYLKERLPDYMVPGVFVPMAELPLTPNGKVDRKSLPEPQRAAGREAAGARTATEEVLAGVWGEALGVESVGIHDNFFELGGHSLLAMQVISKVREVFKVEIALHTLFESPTVAELAEALERGKAGRGDDVPAIVPLPRDADHYQLSFAQQGLWSIDQIMAGNSAYNIPNTFTLKGRLNVEALREAMSEVYRRHDVLRAVFPVVNGQPAQLIREPRQLDLSIIDLAGLSGAARAARVERLARVECRRPFDLSRGPLVRASLIKLSAEEHVVLFTMHHIVSDGWSMNVLMEEVTRLYRDFSRGGPSRLEELPLQYVDYAAWQRQWLRGEALRAELAYWKEQLADLPTGLDVPADGPRPDVQSFRGAQESLLLPRELLDALGSFSRREGSTMYITLLTAYAVLLSWLTSRQDIVIGSPIANRGRAGLEKLIGLFVNMLVLRTDVSGNPTFSELLRRVRDVLLGAYAHHELPFEQLVKELQPARNLSQTPLFQVVFVLEGRNEASSTLPGLSVRPLEVDNGNAQIDLTLRMRETPEGLLSLVRYNSDVYSVARISRLLRLLEALLQKVVARPESRVDEIKEALDKLNREQQSRAAREFSKNRLAKIRG